MVLHLSSREVLYGEHVTMSTSMTHDASGAAFDPDEERRLENTPDSDERPSPPAAVQRPITPAHIFAGVAVAITVFGTIMATLALSAGAHMQRPHTILASKPAQHAAADQAPAPPLAA